VRIDVARMADIAARANREAGFRRRFGVAISAGSRSTRAARLAHTIKRTPALAALPSVLAGPAEIYFREGLGSVEAARAEGLCSCQSDSVHLWRLLLINLGNKPLR
jgi:hypothetical protein